MQKLNFRDGNLCFLFRIGDMRQTHLVEAHLRLLLIKKKVTQEGEILPLQQYDMDVGYKQGDDRVFLAWPVTVSHVIDKDSPLFKWVLILDSNSVCVSIYTWN